MRTIGKALKDMAKARDFKKPCPEMLVEEHDEDCGDPDCELQSCPSYSGPSEEDEPWDEGQVSGKCQLCGAHVIDGEAPDGCRDPACPMGAFLEGEGA
jgi:hypothetical protein